MEQVGKAAERALRGAAGRKDANKQEKPIDLKVLKDRAPELIRLLKKQKDVSIEVSDAFKKAAQDSGLNVSSVRSYFSARAGDNFKDRQRNAEQLALLFDELKG
jgi:hypothetical protein